jgi:hypothetical protein
MQQKQWGTLAVVRNTHKLFGIVGIHNTETPSFETVEHIRKIVDEFSLVLPTTIDIREVQVGAEMANKKI